MNALYRQLLVPSWKPAAAMQRSRKCAAAFWLLALMLATPTALPQSAGGDFAITREAIAGGGGLSAAGDLGAVVTLGQPAAAVSSGGDFVLRGGFHVPALAAAPLPDPIFGNGFESP